MAADAVHACFSHVLVHASGCNNQQPNCRLESKEGFHLATNSSLCRKQQHSALSLQCHTCRILHSFFHMSEAAMCCYNTRSPCAGKCCPLVSCCCAPQMPRQPHAGAAHCCCLLPLLRMVAVAWQGQLTLPCLADQNRSTLQAGSSTGATCSTLRPCSRTDRDV
jgi:hypothetical protein